MAKIQVLKQEGLQHAFSVTVEKSVIDAQKKARLVDISHTTKMAGFRPGKVPMSLVAQRHGATAYAETIDEAVEEVKKALRKLK